MMSDFRGDRPDFRVSDAERDAAMAELGEHFQAGRLDSDEFGQRLDAAAAAQTRSDLDRVLADLPRTAQQAPPSAQPRARRVPAAAVVVAVAIAALVVAAVAIPAVSGSFAGWHIHGHGHWAGHWIWWLIVIPILLLRRVLWRGRRGRSR